MEFYEHLSKHLPSDVVKKLQEALDENRTTSLVLNTAKYPLNDFIRDYPQVTPHSFLENVFYYNKEDYDFGKSDLFDHGAIYIMDTSSMLSSYFLNIQKDDLILDMCAAPGGKTIFSILQNPNINIVANDISYQRALTLSSNIEKIGRENVMVTSLDLLANPHIFTKSFDKIILDAPCSGSAMFRKNDLMKDDWSYEKVLKLTKLQKDLLNHALTLLKDGGELIYSTCSFSYEENEGVILDILEKHNNVEVINIPNNESFYRSKELKEAIHLFPYLYRGEGQFICHLKKNGIPSYSPQKNKFKSFAHQSTKDFNLNFKYYELIKDKIYGFNFLFPEVSYGVLRKGLEIAVIKKNYYLPSFALAHYLSPLNSIILSNDEYLKYKHGEDLTTTSKEKNGFYTVSYNNINLGFVKKVDNKLKNLYPKGLRH